MSRLSSAVLDRLAREDVVWCTTVRPDGSPHTTPVWFSFAGDTWWISGAFRNVKVRNVSADPHVSLALPDGRSPAVAEGLALVHQRGFPVAIVTDFAAKYSGWDITADEPDGQRVLIEVPVTRWLLAGTAR